MGDGDVGHLGQLDPVHREFVLNLGDATKRLHWGQRYIKKTVNRRNILVHWANK